MVFVDEECSLLAERGEAAVDAALRGDAFWAECAAAAAVEWKPGARVMLLHNEGRGGLVNGDTGVVVGFAAVGVAVVGVADGAFVSGDGLDVDGATDGGTIVGRGDGATVGGVVVGAAVVGVAVVGVGDGAGEGKKVNAAPAAAQVQHVPGQS